MTDRPERASRKLTRALGIASLGLAAAPLVRPDSVARITGTDDSGTSPWVIRAVGARELVQALALLAGPPATVWTRVAGDAADLATLEAARRARHGSRARRVSLTTAAVLGITAIDLYAAVRTARAARQHGRGRPGPLHVDASITVNRPVEQVYDYWRNFENLPTFMRHLESVSVDGYDRSHWVAKAPIRRSVEWDAELTGDDRPRRISWRSLPHADIDNSGTVHFETTPDGTGTEVRVSLHHDVPGGAVGRAVARMLGEEPEQQVRDDLRRFKQVLETGDIVRSDGLPEGTDARHKAVQRPAQPVAHEGSRR
jgi:uncharacterized membrane protein